MVPGTTGQVTRRLSQSGPICEELEGACPTPLQVATVCQNQKSSPDCSLGDGGCFRVIVTTSLGFLAHTCLFPPEREASIDPSSSLPPHHSQWLQSPLTCPLLRPCPPLCTRRRGRPFSTTLIVCSPHKARKARKACLTALRVSAEGTLKSVPCPPVPSSSTGPSLCLSHPALRSQGRVLLMFWSLILRASLSTAKGPLKAF